MKKIKRWFLILLSAFVVFLGVGSIVAWHYKPELSAAIHDKIKEHINGEFNIDDISVSFFQDFPHVSVRLEGIYLRGLRYELYKKDFLKAKKVFVNVHLGRLFLGEIDVKSVRIEDAEIFIFKTRSGYSNLDIFKKDSVIALVDSTKKKGSAILNIHTIDLKNVSVAFYDSLKDKAFAAKFVEGRNELSKTDSVRHFKYTGGIDFDRLQFNGKKGSYLLAQQTAAILEGDFTPASHSLSIAPSSLKFKSSTIGISGYFHFVKDGRFKLDITSDDLSYKEGISLMPKALSSKLENYNISNPFALQVHILGSLAPGNDPAVDVLFQTKDAVVTIGKQQATRVTTSGLFTNHVDSTREFNDPNSKIEVTSFEGDVYGFPVKAKASFMNLRDPFLKLNATMTTDAKSVQRQLDSTTFRLTDGQIDAKLIYAGKLNDLIDPARHLVSGQLSGATVLKNVQLHYIPRDLVLNNINALLTFTPQQLLINNMSMLVDKSQIALKGKVDGLAAAFNHADKKIFVRLAVSSANLVTTNLFPEPPKTENVSDKPKGKSLSETIDKLYRRLEFDLSLNVQQFEHGNFKASNITGAVSLKNNHLDGERIRMKLAGGETDVSFGLSDLDKNVNPLWVEANVHRADIRQFFHCFNNFKQKTIDSQNLSGRINASIGMNALLDDDFNVMMPTLIGNVDLTVKDGKLTNFAPLEKMSNFLFKHRDFSDVDFAEIKTTFDLRGTELSIKRMEIESSVMSMFIEGRWSLADSTDLVIQLPLSNLKRRDKDYTPKNVGVDSKVGPSVYLRARLDSKGQMGIAYDPFHKFRKK